MNLNLSCACISQPLDLVLEIQNLEADDEGYIPKDKVLELVEKATKVWKTSITIPASAMQPEPDMMALMINNQKRALTEQIWSDFNASIQVEKD